VKISWSEDYLNQKCGSGLEVHKWLRAKQDKYEAQTGLKWAFWWQHCRWVFQPTWTKETENIEDADLGDQILEATPTMFKTKTFIMLAELTGEPLEKVIGVSKWLCSTGQAVGIIGRTGAACGIHKRG